MPLQPFEIEDDTMVPKLEMTRGDDYQNFRKPRVIKKIRLI